MARIRSGYPDQGVLLYNIRSPWIAIVGTDASNVWKPNSHTSSVLSVGGKSPHHVRSCQAGARIRRGLPARSYLNDYYYRVHIIPQRIDVGNLVSDITREVEVWNAWPENNSLASITSVGGEGILLNGPSAPPTIFKPLESRIYDLTVTSRGSPIIDARFDWNFQKTPASLWVVGRRVLIWPFMPQTEHKESMEWMTDILASFNKEQRLALRTSPRQTFNYTYQLDGQQFSRAKAISTLWAHRTYGVPVWSELTRVGSVLVGSTTIMMNTLHMDFRVGGLVVAWGDDIHNEALEVKEVLPDRLIFERPLVNTYNDCYVAPLRFAITPEGMSYKRGASDYIITSSTFQVVENADLGLSVGYPQYRGKDVLNDPTVLLDELSERISRSTDVFDNGSGPIVLELKNNWVSSSKVLTFDTLNREERWAARQWIHSRRGKQKSFWIPSWNPDLIIVEDISNLSAYIVVRNIGYTSYYNVKDIMVKLTNGTLLFARITHGEITPSGNEKLFIETPNFPETPASSVEMVCFMSHVRFNSDNIGFRHSYAGRASTSIPLLETPE